MNIFKRFFQNIFHRKTKSRGKANIYVPAPPNVIVVPRSPMPVREDILSIEEINELRKLSGEDVAIKYCFWDGSGEEKAETFEGYVKGIREKKIYDMLSQNINSAYAILPHVSLREIFWLKSGINDFGSKLSKLSMLHVDFLILYRNTWKPLAVIEIDGSYHQTDPNQIANDRLKDSLFERRGIPVFRIPVSDSRLYDLSYYKQLFSDFQKFPVYHRFCGSKMLFRGNAYDPYYECWLCNQKYKEHKYMNRPNWTYINIDIVKNNFQPVFR